MTDTPKRPPVEEWRVMSRLWLNAPHREMVPESTAWEWADCTQRLADYALALESRLPQSGTATKQHPFKPNRNGVCLACQQPVWDQAHPESERYHGQPEPPAPTESDEEAARRITLSEGPWGYFPNTPARLRCERAVLAGIAHGRAQGEAVMAELRAELEAAEAVHDDNEAATVEEHAQYDRLAAEARALREALAEAVRVVGTERDTAQFYQLLEEIVLPKGSIDELIKKSSFGTPGARAIRDRTPKSVVDEVMSKIKKGKEGK